MRAQRNLTSVTAVIALAFLALLGTGTHTVGRGETLSEIAAQYGTTPAALARANGIADLDLVLAGARLKVPGATSAAASYRVRSGDTLGSIAARAGTTIAALVEANALKNPNLVRVGQVLVVPAAGAGAGGTITPAGGALHHVVRSGETIGGIASRYGITQRQLVDANGLTGGVIYAGQRLSLVPTTTAPAPAAGQGSTTHRVTAGQTLSGIAQRYGTTVRAIEAANAITDPNLVVVGRVLTIPATSGGASSLRCPVQGRVTFMNDWGFPRSGGRFHEGTDIFAARGTPAVAVVSGTATQKTGHIGGRQVTLRGDDGATYHYTHLDSFGKGGRVAAGEVIGTVGTSGNAAGGPPHVHFEVHPGGGAAVNPYPRIRPVC